MADRMFRLIDQVRKNQDTIGGVVTGVIKNMPAGLGEPVFDKLHANLGKATLEAVHGPSVEASSQTDEVTRVFTQLRDTLQLMADKGVRAYSAAALTVLP